MPRPRPLLAILATSLLAACGSPNPNFCEGPTCDDVDARIDGSTQTCTGSGADPACAPDNPICTGGLCGGMCGADPECASRTDGNEVCLLPTGDCVACDESDSQAPPGSAEDECTTAAMAVCDAQTHTCRACEAHTECASGVCDAGTCVAAANVVYMKADGTDNGTCNSPATGCRTMHFAKSMLSAARKYIVMAPSATPYDTRSDTNFVDFNGVGESAHIIGYGATLNRIGGANGHVLEVKSGAVVIIEGLTISNALGASEGTGIVNSATLELRQAVVRDCAFVGVNSSGTLRVLRSRIHGNDGGGINVQAGAFAMIDNFIFNNGDNQASFGGVNISTTTSGNTLEFNTIAFNASGAGASDGVSCTNVGLAARNNIIFGSLGKPHVNVGTTCTFTHTLHGPDGLLAGAGNMLVADQSAFMFVSASDLHVRAGTVATGKALAASLSLDAAVDIDGNPRQQDGTMVEVGADEIP